MKKVLLLLMLFILLFVNYQPAYSLRALSANYELVLNVPTKRLLLYNKGLLEKEYPVGVGKALTPTPLGEFKITRKISNPAWVNPYRQSNVISSGPSNPIGQYWLGFALNTKNQEYGFHATSDLNSIGKASTHGCIRMYPQHVKELFDLVKIGTAVHIIYNPVEVKEYENKLFIRAYPDIYGYMDDSLYIKFAKNQLTGANLVQEKNLYKAIESKDEKDYFIGWTGAQNTIPTDDSVPDGKGGLN